MNEALRRLIGQGAKLRSFSTEILQQCFDESQTIYAELSADSTDFKDVFDSMWAFRDDQYKWQQVGELRSDVFNVSTVRK
jgi:TRAP-type mannitol/chloroaromatic compound transport system substrate-binding protein